MTSTINATRRGILAAGSALGALSATSTANAAKKRTVAVPATETVWLDGAAPIHTDGVTFGVPWPQGAVKANATAGDLAGRLAQMVGPCHRCDRGACQILSAYAGQARRRQGTANRH